MSILRCKLAIQRETLTVRLKVSLSQHARRTVFNNRKFALLGQWDALVMAPMDRVTGLIWVRSESTVHVGMEVREHEAVEKSSDEVPAEQRKHKRRNRTLREDFGD